MRTSRVTEMGPHETSSPRTRLVLYGPAQLLHGGDRVKLRAKGLALLYVLALEGPARREWIAELLWGHGDSAGNLRVELHRLRKRLGAIGVPAFPAGQEPLELPVPIGVEARPVHGDVEPLLGLDDLSPDFQPWLERHRDRLAHGSSPSHTPIRKALLEELLRRIRMPYLLILRGPPGSGRQNFVETLADRLQLPLDREALGTGRAIHLIDSEVAEAQKVARHILDQRTGIWAMTQSTFGRETELLLRLRGLFPAERMRYLEFQSLSWQEARKNLLPHLTFEQAARIYVETGGHYGFINELLRQWPNGGFGSELPLPQRIRAAYLLAAHDLPEPVRRVLDRLSVHPGPLSDRVVERLGLAQHLDTLELAGWMRFDGRWTFADETARRVIYGSLHQGRQRHYHAALADAFAAAEPASELATGYHGAMAGREVALDDQLRRASPWGGVLFARTLEPESGAPPPHVAVAPGREHALLLERQRRLHATDEDDWSHWVRRPQEKEASFAEYALPDEPCLVRLDAHVYTESVFDVGFGGDAYPLGLHFVGGSTPNRQIVFVGVPEPEELANGMLLLPQRTSLQATFVCEHRLLRIECRAEAGIVEFRLQANALAGTRSESGGAYDLRVPARGERVVT